MKFFLAISSIILALNSSVLCADPISTNIPITPKERQAVNNAVAKLSKKVETEDLKVSAIKRTPIPGLLEVNVDTNVFYVYGDQFVFVGNLLDLNKSKNNWDITEQTLRQIRKDMIATIEPKDMIIYPATKPKIGTVMVFVDVDCMYCHKMEKNLKQYADAGIELRYLAFPRTAPGTPSYEKTVSVWCATDRKSAASLAMEGKEIPKNICKNNPVARELELGIKLGVGGTPTMILDNGAKYGGFIDPENLAKLLKEQSKGNN